ncbi:MAG: TM0106 family RecB-like putative nuclease [Candidatus Omnitrophica bacterium]|nr:TM0106 family RecB-like putative nuclease [Candidatus Omnitrophota bacterium]MDD5670496.1 TM0106 family RecB-like putative nuclease [Candidatus Omnitrophota bacterium]
MNIDKPITASMLYDYTRCPTRVALDLFEDREKRDPINPFVQMLWDRGHFYENEVVSNLQIEHVSFRGRLSAEREELTEKAMQEKAPLILGGRIRAGDLLGDPDLLRLEGEKYIAGDIKSGAGEESDGEDDTKPKKHYAVQLALYTDILEQKGLSTDRHAFVWDVHGEEVHYDFSIPQGPRTPQTYWDYYQSILESVRVVARKKVSALPAYASICKMCYWMTTCKKTLIETNDITLIPELGRSKRDSLIPYAKTVEDFAYCQGFPKIKGIGEDTIAKFQRRAKLLSSNNKRPYLLKPVELWKPEIEIFFDIETDPLREICYLHGFVERVGGDNSTEKYISFFSDTTSQEDEKKIFSEAFQYLAGRENSLFYYYSKYERTIYRKLQEKYPDICSREDIESLFDPQKGIDLYNDVVTKFTVWPTYSHSIKDLAVYLGFKWRDQHPSGAASIEWYDQWIRSQKPEHKQRILDYNEDDCVATRVLLDGIRGLKVKK